MKLRRKEEKRNKKKFLQRQDLIMFTIEKKNQKSEKVKTKKS